MTQDHEPTADGPEDGSGDLESRVLSLRFLTLQQVADELATTTTTIRGLIRSGDLPAIQIGGRGQWRVERVKLEEYITNAYTRARTDIARGAINTGTPEAESQ